MSVSDDDRVTRQVIEQLKLTDEGRRQLASSLRQAAWTFEDNAHEYARSGAFDYTEQLRLAALARQRADQLDLEPAPADPLGDIPF